MGSFVDLFAQNKVGHLQNRSCTTYAKSSSLAFLGSPITKLMGGLHPKIKQENHLFDFESDEGVVEIAILADEGLKARNSSSSLSSAAVSATPTLTPSSTSVSLKPCPAWLSLAHCCYNCNEIGQIPGTCPKPPRSRKPVLLIEDGVPDDDTPEDPSTDVFNETGAPCESEVCLAADIGMPV